MLFFKKKKPSTNNIKQVEKTHYDNPKDKYYGWNREKYEKKYNILPDCGFMYEDFVQKFLYFDKNNVSEDEYHLMGLETYKINRNFHSTTIDEPLLFVVK